MLSGLTTVGLKTILDVSLTTGSGLSVVVCCCVLGLFLNELNDLGLEGDGLALLGAGLGRLGRVRGNPLTLVGRTRGRVFATVVDDVVDSSSLLFSLISISMSSDSEPFSSLASSAFSFALIAFPEPNFGLNTLGLRVTASSLLLSSPFNCAIISPTVCFSVVVEGDEAGVLSDPSVLLASVVVVNFLLRAEKLSGRRGPKREFRELENGAGSRFGRGFSTVEEEGSLLRVRELSRPPVRLKLGLDNLDGRDSWLGFSVGVSFSFLLFSMFSVRSIFSSSLEFWLKDLDDLDFPNARRFLKLLKNEGFLRFVSFVGDGVVSTGLFSSF